MLLKRFRASFSVSGTVQGLIFCFWDGSGSYFLLLGRFRVSISPSGKVQGLIFCFWGGSGSKFLLMEISEKGSARISRKSAIFTSKPCGQDATSRTGPELLSHFCFWDGSGSHFLLLGRFRVSFSVSGTVQGLNFSFWEGSGSYFLLLSYHAQELLKSSVC